MKRQHEICVAAFSARGSIVDVVCMRGKHAFKRASRFVRRSAGPGGSIKIVRFGGFKQERREHPWATAAQVRRIVADHARKMRKRRRR